MAFKPLIFNDIRPIVNPLFTTGASGSRDVSAPPEISWLVSPPEALILPRMLADLLRRLTSTDTEPLSRHDSRVALAALMVRVARTDGSYSPEERDRIDRVLADQYRLDAGAARSLRSEAEIAEEGAPDTVQFTRVVKDAVPYDERSGVVEALWRVAAADGINADEHGLMRLVANLLGVSDVDSGLARQRAMRDDG
jgi:uncharacterized tellurite resistance protein B-like protein